MRRGVAVPFVPLDPEVADCYAVQRKPGKFRVRHYPTRDADRHCCLVVVKVEEADAAHPGGAESGALHRAYLTIQQHHEEKAC